MGGLPKLLKSVECNFPHVFVFRRYLPGADRQKFGPSANFTCILLETGRTNIRFTGKSKFARQLENNLPKNAASENCLSSAY